MIYTWEITCVWRDTSLLPLWRRFNRQEQSSSSSCMPRMGMNTCSPQTRKPSREAKEKSQGCREAITHPTSWFGGGCPIRGWHLFILVRKGWKLVPKCIKRTCYKKLWKLLAEPSSVVRNGSSSKTQLQPTRPRQPRSGWRGTFRPSSAPGIGPSGVQTSDPWTINCGLFWSTWCAERVTTWRAWGDPSYYM